MFSVHVQCLLHSRYPVKVCWLSVWTGETKYFRSNVKVFLIPRICFICLPWVWPRSNYWIKVVFSQGPAITSLSFFSKSTMGLQQRLAGERGGSLCMFNIYIYFQIVLLWGWLTLQIWDLWLWDLQLGCTGWGACSLTVLEARYSQVVGGTNFLWGWRKNMLPGWIPITSQIVCVSLACPHSSLDFLSGHVSLCIRCSLN